MSKLKITYECTNCECNGYYYNKTVEDITDLNGICPNCNRKSIFYYCENTVKEFLQILSDMTPAEQYKNYDAIILSANQLSQKL